MKKTLFAALLLATPIILSSCKDDDASEPSVANSSASVEVRNLYTYRKSGVDTLTSFDVIKNGIKTQSKFIANDTIVYFSLEKDTIIDKSKSATLEWDIAFNKTTIWVNGGVKGKGKGEAQILVNQDYSLLSAAPEAGYRQETDTARAILTGSDKGWYHYDMDKSEVTPIPGKIIVLKTASGKYAKMQILNYYFEYPNNIPTDPKLRTDRCYSFKYFVQKDGSRNLNN